MSSLSTRAMRGALATLGGQWGRFMVQLASLAILARLLTPGDYGVVSMVMAVAGLAYVVGDFGLSMAAVQAKHLTQAQGSNLFWLNTVIGFVLGAAVFFSAEPLAEFYDRPELASVAEAVSWIFVISGFSAQFRAEATRRMRFSGMAFADVASQAAALVVAVSIALLGGGYWALVAQQITQAAVTLIALIVISRWMPSWPSRRVSLQGMIKFGANTSGVQLINYASSNADSIIVGRAFGAEALGVYDRAFQLFKMPLQQIAAPITRVALPILSGISDNDLYNRYLVRAQLLLCYSLGGVFFFAIVLSNPVLAIMLGDGWGDATGIFRVLAVGGVFQALGYVYYWVFLSRALTGLQLRYTVFTKIVMIGLMIGGAFFGPLGVAAGVSGGLFFHWLILTFFAIPRARVDINPVLAVTLRPLMVYITMMVPGFYIGMLVEELPSIVQILIIGAACLAYISLTLVIPAVRRDGQVILRTIRTAAPSIRSRAATSR